MKNTIRIITIAVFIITAIPISTCLRKGAEENIEQYKEARKVNTEKDFAEALKTDGWIYAEGEIIGKAPLQKLKEGKKSLNLNINTMFHDDIDIDRIIHSLKSDFLWVKLVTGEVIREKDNDPFKINQEYSATAEAESVTFLGQTFDAKKILVKIPSVKVEQYPDRGSSVYGYEVQGIKSPYYTWLVVLVSNGQIVEKELRLTADNYIQKLKLAAEGNSNKLHNTTIAGFLGFWLILMFVVLWLEGKYIK